MLQIAQKVLLFSTFFVICICLHAQQWLGAPLYIIRRSWFYQWQTYVKQSTALLILALNQICAPATVRISYDDGVLPFPSRLVLMANHQIYTDWIFFWWTAYNAGYHGDIFIILKDSLRMIPVLGPGMMFFSFIFMSRKWETDLPRMKHRLSHLSNDADTPMWLLIFPEGTNMSTRAQAASNRWSEKLGKPAPLYTLVPRTRGLQFCLQQLAKTVDWVYDGTIAYDGIPPGEYGQEVHSLKGLWIDGQKAPLTHLHWRRFAVKDIPLDNEAFDEWLNQRWLEKEALMKHHQEHGSFPAADHVDTKVQVSRLSEYLQILYSIPAAVVILWLASLVIKALR